MDFVASLLADGGEESPKAGALLSPLPTSPAFRLLPGAADAAAPAEDAGAAAAAEQPALANGAAEAKAEEAAASPPAAPAPAEAMEAEPASAAGAADPEAKAAAEAKEEAVAPADEEEEEEDCSEDAIRLVRWHMANLEYGCSARLSEISAPHWNQDEEAGGFGGPHCMVVGGYGQVFDAMAAALDVRLGAAVTEVSPEAASRVRRWGGPDARDGGGGHDEDGSAGDEDGSEALLG